MSSTLNSLFEDDDITAKLLLLELVNKVEQTEKELKLEKNNDSPQLQITNIDKNDVCINSTLSSRDTDKNNKVATEILNKEKVATQNEPNTSLTIDKNKPPKLIAEFSLNDRNCFKGAKWSPDGSCLLSNSEDSTLRVFSPSNSLFDLEKAAKSDQIFNLKPSQCVKESEIVYDYCWFPRMNKEDPLTCCFASSSKDEPVHLWDALTGKLKASYLSFSDKEVLQSAQSISISLDGTQMLCGYKGEVNNFYIDHPGTESVKFKTKKKKCSYSQPGIISSVAFAPNEKNTMFACGSYEGSLGLYDTRNGKTLGFCKFSNKGVTSVKWSYDSNRIYAGLRQDSFLGCWDIRYLQEPLMIMERQVNTSQRINFDIMPHQYYELESIVASGGTDGKVTFYQLTNQGNVDLYLTSSKLTDFTAHSDCTNGCEFNPVAPILLTTSGQRSFYSDSVMSDLSSCSEDDEIIPVKRRRRREENSLKLWLLPLR